MAKRNHASGITVTRDGTKEKEVGSEWRGKISYKWQFSRKHNKYSDYPGFFCGYATDTSYEFCSQLLEERQVLPLWQWLPSLLSGLVFLLLPHCMPPTAHQAQSFRLYTNRVY